jgi:hypothetical protein
MISPEAEKVSLGRGLKARGNVEDWLGKVEEGMFSNLRKLVKSAMVDYQRKTREEFVLCHASQVKTALASMMKRPKVSYWEKYLLVISLDNIGLGTFSVHFPFLHILNI